MAKVQIIMPVTLDGFLPDKNEKLMVWLNTDRNGSLIGKSGLHSTCIRITACLT